MTLKLVFNRASNLSCLFAGHDQPAYPREPVLGREALGTAALVSIPGQPLAGSVTLSELTNLSVPRFLHLPIEDKGGASSECSRMTWPSGRVRAPPPPCNGPARHDLRSPDRAAEWNRCNRGRVAKPKIFIFLPIAQNACQGPISMLGIQRLGQTRKSLVSQKHHSAGGT